MKQRRVPSRVSCIAVILASAVVVGCEDNPIREFPSKPVVVDSPRCREFSDRIGKLLEQDVSEDALAEKRHEQELNSLTENLRTASEGQREIAMNNLTTRQEIEDRARENKQNNQVEAVRQQSRDAGCLLDK
jgi:hypothetical protein